MLSTSWAPATLDLVTWELTKSCGLFPAAMDAWLHPAAPSPRSRFLAAISAHLVQQSQSYNAHAPAQYAREGFFIPDPLAACVAVGGEAVIEDAAVCGVLVETGGRHTRGATICDWRAASGDLAPPCVRVIRAVRRERVEALLIGSTTA